MSTRAPAVAGARAANKALAEMNPELRDEFEAIQNLLTKVEQGQVLARHEVGERIAKITETPATYGEKGAETLAEGLGIDIQELYRCRQLALCYSLKELQSLLKIPMAGSGRCIGWTHLDLLCRVPKDGLRTQLQERVLKQGLTTRELAAAIQLKLGKRGGGKGRPRVGIKTPGGALSTLSSNAQKESLLIADVLPQLDKALDAPASFNTPAFVESVREARDNVRTARDTFSEVLVKLDSLEAVTAKSLRMKTNQAQADLTSPRATKRAAAKETLNGNGHTGKTKVNLPAPKTRIVLPVAKAKPKAARRVPAAAGA